MKGLGLYIHIPFCLSKCNYCDFYSIAGADEEKKDRYVSALVKHMQEYKIQTKNYIVSSVYIGGGTPTVLDPDSLQALCLHLRSSVDLSVCGEFTVEAGRPDTVTEEKGFYFGLI